MSQNNLRYPTVLFDWGDTVMHDYPERTNPMVEWETVEVVEGIADVLAYLHSTGRRIVLATSAAISDEEQIRAALKRGGLDTQYFSGIYCFKNTSFLKGELFYRYILDDLQLSASDALMVGDGFEKDIQIPNALGNVLQYGLIPNRMIYAGRKCISPFIPWSSCVHSLSL